MGRSTTLLADEENFLGYLVRSRPEERDRLQPYVRRAKAYRNECGCAMSGAFLVTALLFVLMHGVWRHISLGSGLLVHLALYAVFVLGAGLIGKVVGIAVARVRLAFLYRDLRHQFVSGD